MSSVLDIIANNRGEDCIAFVGVDRSKPGGLQIKVIGRESQKSISTVFYESAKTFVQDIPKFFTPQFKGVLFCVTDFETSEFSNNIEFCKAARAQLDALQIPYYFISSNDFITSLMLIKCNVTVQPQQTVLFISVHNNLASISEGRYTEKGYEFLKIYMVDIDLQENSSTIREKLLRSSNPQKILVMYKSDAWATANFLHKHVLKLKNVIITDTDMGSDLGKHILEWSKWLLDKSYTKFYVIPRCARIYTVMAPFSNNRVLYADISDTVPCTKSTFVSKVNGMVVLMCSTFVNLKFFTVSSIGWIQGCHAVQVTLSIDADNIPSLNCEPVVLPMIQRMPEFLVEKVAEKVPMITFYDDCSIISVYDEAQRGYKFLDAWNGQYGQVLAMSFGTVKPLFGPDVYGNLNLKPATIVYDLIEIMSMPEDDIIIDQSWPFSFTKDEQNPVLIEFESFNGSRKSLTPVFLMAMFLKEHVKAIKAETGINHNKVGFHCLYPGGNEDDKNRIEKKLREAFKFLKIECVTGMFEVSF